MFPETVPNVAVRVVVPAPIAVANPCEPWIMEMSATAVFDEVQVTVAVRSCDVLSENVPRALNCKPLPMMMLGLAGVTVIDVSTTAVTVSVAVFDVTPAKLALTEVVPTERAVARPFVPAALLIVATCVLLDAHVADAVMSFVEPSEYEPVAVNCCVLPTATLGLEGVIEIDVRFAGFTVSDAEFEETPLKDAMIEVDPAPIDTASPGDPVPVPIDATDGVDELHTA